MLVASLFYALTIISFTGFEKETLVTSLVAFIGIALVILIISKLTYIFLRIVTGKGNFIDTLFSFSHGYTILSLFLLIGSLLFKIPYVGLILGGIAILKGIIIAYASIYKSLMDFYKTDLVTTIIAVTFVYFTIGFIIYLVSMQYIMQTVGLETFLASQQYWFFYFFLSKYCSYIRKV